MAFTKRLIESVMQTAGYSTSGYQADVEINRNLAMVENDLIGTLVPLWEDNQNVRDMLSPFITPPTILPVSSGGVELPVDYVQIIDSNYNRKPIYKRNVNEISIIETSPIRKPDLEKGPYYCYFLGKSMRVLPQDIPEVEMMYIRQPIPGEIVFDIREEEDRDYVELSVVRETEWPEKAFNLLYYSMLEKYGVEKTSQLAMEYSQLGINKEISKV